MYKLEFLETEGILKEKSMIPKMFKQQKHRIGAYIMLKSEVEAPSFQNTKIIKSEGLLAGFIRDCGMLLECIFQFLMLHLLPGLSAGFVVLS